MRLLVFEYKVVSLDYFEYKMQPSELRFCADNLRYTYRPQWDIARTLSMFMAAPYTKKKLKVRDLFPLPWDNENEVHLTEEQERQHVESMRELAQIMTQNLNQSKKEDETKLQGQGTRTEVGLQTDDGVRETDGTNV